MLRPEEGNPADIPQEVAQKGVEVPPWHIGNVQAMQVAVDDPNAVHQLSEIILLQQRGQILSRLGVLKIETARLVYSPWESDGERCGRTLHATSDSDKPVVGFLKARAALEFADDRGLCIVAARDAKRQTTLRHIP